MRLQNGSRYPEAEIRRLVEFATHGVNLTRVAVVLRNSRYATAGRAYSRIPSLSPWSKRGVDALIVLRIGAPTRFPANNSHGSWRYGAWTDSEGARPDGVPESARMQRRRNPDRSGRLQYRWRWRIQHPYGGMRSPAIEQRDWREGVVYIAAHEARHIQQHQRSRPASEVDAERFAAAALVRWRAASA